MSHYTLATFKVALITEISSSLHEMRLLLNFSPLIHTRTIPLAQFVCAHVIGL